MISKHFSKIMSLVSCTVCSDVSYRVSYCGTCIEIGILS